MNRPAGPKKWARPPLCEARRGARAPRWNLSISDRFPATANVSPGFSRRAPFRGHGRARPRPLDRPLGLPPVPGVQLRAAVLVAQGGDQVRQAAVEALGLAR